MVEDVLEVLSTFIESTLKPCWIDYFPAALIATLVIGVTVAIYTANPEGIIPWARRPPTTMPTEEPRVHRARTLSSGALAVSDALGGSIQTDAEALSAVSWAASFFGGGCLEGYANAVTSKAKIVWQRAPPVRKYLCCFPQPLSDPEEEEQQQANGWATPELSESAERRWHAWTAHWVMKSSEDDKAEAAMKKQGVPYIVRKLFLRWRPERKFTINEDGYLELNSKSMLGGWIVLCSAPGTEQIGSYFGYKIRTVMSWEGDTMIAANHVTDPSGTTQITLSKHCELRGNAWIEPHGPHWVRTPLSLNPAPMRIMVDAFSLVDAFFRAAF